MCSHIHQISSLLSMQIEEKKAALSEGGIRESLLRDELCALQALTGVDFVPGKTKVKQIFFGASVLCRFTLLCFFAFFYIL